MSLGTRYARMREFLLSLSLARRRAFLSSSPSNTDINFPRVSILRRRGAFRWRRLRAKLASSPCAANRREIEAIVRATNAFAAAFVRLGELQTAFQNPLMCVCATCPSLWRTSIARATAIQGKSMRIQCTNQ